MYSQTFKLGTYFYSDDGKEIGRYRVGEFGEILMFNCARMDVSCFDSKASIMTYVQRAKPQYRDDFSLLVDLYPNAKQTEYSGL